MSLIESVILRGDVAGLSPEDRTRYYVQMCESLGLNPMTQPLAFLRLSGKEVLYVTRGATDQLAAIHKLNREIVDGPKVIDLAGTKLVYAVCRATHPNGRIETAVATLPFQDPVNVLMKAESKAKRRATLSILGLGLLDEMELETIPAHLQSPGTPVELPSHGRRGDPPDPEPVDVDVQPTWEEVVLTVTSAAEAVSAWIERLDDWRSDDRYAIRAWDLLVERVRTRFDPPPSRTATSKRLKELVTAATQPTPPDGGGAPTSAEIESDNAAEREAIQSEGSSPTAASLRALGIERPQDAAALAQWKDHLAECAGPVHVGRSYRRHVDELPTHLRAEAREWTVTYLSSRYPRTVRDAEHAAQILDGTAEPMKVAS